MRVLFIILFLFPVVVFSQKLPEVEGLNRVILNHKDSIIYAHLLPIEKNKKRTASDKYWYCWYSVYDIKETRGGFSGKLLHGEYVEYYGNKDLKRKGYFKKGLRTGKWKSWHRDGQLSEIAFYKNGMKQGKCLVYSTDGTLLEKVWYSKGVRKEKKVKKEKEKKGEEERQKRSKEEKNKLDEGKKNGGDLKKEKKKRNSILRFRRGIKVVPQDGKST